MRLLSACTLGILVIGCSKPPPTSTAAVATEPTKLFWGGLQAPAVKPAESQLDPPLDFVVVAGTAEPTAGGHAGKMWSDTIETAAANNEACVFTSFVGWGSSASQVTFMNGGAEEARQFAPPAAGDAGERIAWLAKTSEAMGTQFVTVPAMGDTSGTLTLPDAGQINFDGLVGAWAEENTRPSIFAAFARNEVYATTGPRIRLRFFGGWAFDGKLAKAPNMVSQGYTLGFPMGARLPAGPKGKAPGFMMYAIKDPKGSDLDRVQVVKGWLDASGGAHEQVFDAAVPKASDPSRKERKKGVVPTPADELSAPALNGFWADPHFDPAEPAYYYMRALEMPPSGSTQGQDPAAVSTTRAHAYSAPIWYTPAPASTLTHEKSDGHE